MSTDAEIALQPVPAVWKDWPIEMVRLLEECYDIVLAESETGIVTMDEILPEMAKWLPGMGMEPWADHDMPVLRRSLWRHLRRYIAEGCPEGGLAPVGMWGPGAVVAQPRIHPVVRLQPGGLCSRGHLLDEQTLNIRGNGRRECKACKRLNEARRRGQRVR